MRHGYRSPISCQTRTVPFGVLQGAKQTMATSSLDFVFGTKYMYLRFICLGLFCCKIVFVLKMEKGKL
jgi:hypothetical protein